MRLVPEPRDARAKLPGQRQVQLETRGGRRIYAVVRTHTHVRRWGGWLNVHYWDDGAWPSMSDAGLHVGKYTLEVGTYRRRSFRETQRGPGVVTPKLEPPTAILGPQ